jgi:methyl-accepting chemotaxis protein
MTFFLQRHFLIIALVVGSILNLINQGDVLLSGGETNYLKIAFTYCVPYLVASVSSWVTLNKVDTKQQLKN